MMRRLHGHATAALLLTLLLTAAPADAPVADAAQRGDLDAVRALLRQGADVNAAQGDGMTALHWAARRGDAKMAEVLLYAGAHHDATTRLGAYTPLHLAARYGHAPMVKTLLDAGADATTPTSTGATPMHLAAGAGSAEAIRLLAAAGADVDAREGAHRQTPLHWAAAFDRLEAVRTLLALGADPAATTTVVDYVQLAAFDGPDRMRRQKLVVAQRQAAKEAEEQEKALLAGGATTVADVAAAQLQAREEPVAGAPQEAGLDSTRVPGGATSSTGGTGGGAPAARSGGNEERPLSYTDLVGKEGGLAPLHYAAREGHMDVALALLDAGADVNQPTAGDHTTPLLMAAINGNYDLAMEFIARGADPNIVSEDGVAPLFATLNNRWAPKAFYPQPTMFKQQKTSYLELMKALLDAGADVNHRIDRHVWYTSYNFDILGVKFDGATAFWRAAYATDVEAMKLLVAYGADPNIPTQKTPSRRFRRSRQNADGPDPSGLPPVPNGGPAVFPIHAASGVGYGVARAGNSHRHVPDGWLPAVKYLVEELGADVNVRDHDGYSAVHHAAARGDNELIKYLVSKGAIVTFVSRRGQTTVDMANGPQQRVQPFPETIALLEGLGAKNNHNCLSC